MPKFEVGNMWDAYDKVDLFLITTNGVIKVKANGERGLIMGAGIAHEALLRFPGLDTAIAEHLNKVRVVKSPGFVEYQLIVNVYSRAISLGCFQTKHHYGDSSHPNLIARSVLALKRWCEKNPTKTVALNFPGIGKGRLVREDVLPLLMDLPEQVTIWERPR